MAHLKKLVLQHSFLFLRELTLNKVQSFQKFPSKRDKWIQDEIVTRFFFFYEFLCKYKILFKIIVVFTFSFSLWI